MYIYIYIYIHIHIYIYIYIYNIYIIYIFNILREQKFWFTFYNYQNRKFLKEVYIYFKTGISNLPLHITKQKSFKTSFTCLSGKILRT